MTTQLPANCDLPRPLFQRAAFLVRPHAGGTYSVFTSQREAFRHLGIELQWVASSDQPEALASDPQFSAELPRGHLIDARGKDETTLCRELLTQLDRGGYDLVFVNVLTSLPEMSIAAHLPAHVRRVMIVHSITPGTFSGAKAVAPYVQASIGVSPRIRDELVARVKTPEDMSFAVPNVIDFSPYDNIQRTSSDTFRLVFLGRMSDMDKGVFFLPGIVERLNPSKGPRIQITLAGDGPDLPRLKSMMARFGEQVQFIGRVLREDIPALMARHDALIMPSRFEGLPLTLLESMAAGCVPVASRIRGSTSYVVKDRQTGLLFEIGNTAQAAGLIWRLAEDRQLLKNMSEAARKDVRDRFSVESMAAHYREILPKVAAAPLIPPRPGQVTLLRPGGAWRRLVPARVKAFLRKRMYRK